MPSDHRGRGRGSRDDSQPRSVLVSKALSRLLRHAAVQEHIPIDNHGYVRMDHLLAWQKLRSMKPPVTFDEVIEVVEDNNKKRFALKYVAKDETPDDTATSTQPNAEARAETETETQHAISMFQSTKDDKNVEQYFIRATQGHSMKSIESENLLTPITLDDPASIPSTIVHGTFYGAWDRILQTGGLKRMTRNHVHFATGPALDEALSESNSNNKKSRLDSLLGKNKVISGMRSDAQILIYVDVRKALEEEKDMKWWRSENGVILTEGVPAVEDDQKMVPIKYWIAAVEVKKGLGLLWQHEQGVVRELPEYLRNRAVPRGKNRGT
ncbi:uncharacterized protein Z518_11072 [Rhinocladiella mackenziei CBS 650.93]|uniref:2'-phosphotransferase n=1 Tax=Rhinocladiella mackenziei CBS 650.93 TaxID=1442369 RepID=A0A0D2ISC4_9EURO|nr:uncharacterized protein Z518_11072 [Rhinocladiella mackenziei CBS 650.93]KIW99659.1 hypothetical protein Z518_11072 [Rhinocladiella mackenziei CBS 650.93]